MTEEKRRGMADGTESVRGEFMRMILKQFNLKCKNIKVFCAEDEFSKEY